MSRSLVSIKTHSDQWPLLDGLHAASLGAPEDAVAGGKLDRVDPGFSRAARWRICPNAALPRTGYTPLDEDTICCDSGSYCAGRPRAGWWIAMLKVNRVSSTDDSTLRVPSWARAISEAM
jgi:hypothetical protein